MKKGASTFFLRGVITLMGLAVAALCIFILIQVTPGEAGGYYPIVIGLVLTAIPFFIALYQTMKLLGYIDQNSAFSELSIRALKNIKYCALVIGGAYLLGMPYIMRVAEIDDAPGVVAIGLVITAASIVIAVFAAVLQKLVRNALDMKSEIDLTV